MTRHYSFYAPDRLESALLRVAAQSSRNTARLQQELDDLIEARLEDVVDDMTSGLSTRSRRFPLARWRGDNFPATRWRGEITRSPQWWAPGPITIEVDGPHALTHSTRSKRNVSAAVTCLLDLVREHEADLQRLRARSRQQQVGLELVVQREQALERRAPEDALPPRDATATNEHTILAVLAAIAAAVLLESTLLSGLTRGGDPLAAIAGHLLAILGAVVIFFAIEKLPFWKRSADTESAPEQQRTWAAPMKIAPTVLAALAIATVLTLVMLAFSQTTTEIAGKEAVSAPRPPWAIGLDAIAAPKASPSAQPTTAQPTPTGTSAVGASGTASPGPVAPTAPAARGAKAVPGGTDIW